MLTHLRSRDPVAMAVLAVCLLAATIIAQPAPPAHAQGGADCPNGVTAVIDGEQICYVYRYGRIPPQGESVELNPPRGGGGGVETWCIRRSDRLDGPAGPWQVLCDGGDGLGWYIPNWDCYAQRLDEDEGAVALPGMWGYDEHGDNGVVYEVHCYPPHEDKDENPHWQWTAEGGLWFGNELRVGPADPPGYDGTPSVIPGLWVEAVNALVMRGPRITTAPPIETSAVVNLPVWLWTETGGTVWPEEELHQFAEAPEVGQRVDAYARPLRIVWEMGDDQDPVTCQGPGTAWEPTMDFLRPGECHHTYRRASHSQPGGVFEITAMTTWHLWWEINGDFDGELELQAGSTATLQVNEIQVLTTRP